MNVNAPAATMAEKKSSPCSLESRPPSKSLMLRSATLKNKTKAATIIDAPSRRVAAADFMYSSPVRRLKVHAICIVQMPETKTSRK